MESIVKRGRPIGSNVRQNMIEILYFLKSAHGYHIFKVYKQIYPKITLRGIYYHLKKGQELGEFEIAEINNITRFDDLVEFLEGRELFPKVY